MGNKQYHLDRKEIHDLMGKLHPAIYTYHKNEFIKNSFDNRKLYLVLEGIVYFYTQNEQYDEEIVAFFPCGHLFPGSLMTETDGQSLHFAICKTNCKIAAIDVVEAAHYHIFHSFVGNKCCLLEFTYHFTSLFLAWHCHILQQKTVRSKIMVFLQCQSECQQSTCIHIEMPYSDLSNFLQVDRSTLMKELAKMESEELIQKNGRYITLQQLHSEIYRIPI